MEDIESIHSMETFEDDEGERPYTVEGEGLAARIENAFSMPAEIYRSSSAACPSKDNVAGGRIGSGKNSPVSFATPVPPPQQLQTGSERSIHGRQKHSRSQGMYNNIPDAGLNTKRERVGSVKSGSRGGWASHVRSPNDREYCNGSSNGAIGGIGMNRMSSSPNSVGLEIYDDDDDSILTEESGEDLTQSMQSLALTSSLGEDFLSLFAPG